MVDITNFIKRYFDLDLIASQTVEFLYSKKESFSTGMDTGKIQQKSKIERRQFTDKEKALSENEKIALLKNIKDALSIECVYSEDIDKTPDSLLESMLGTNSKEIIMDFSKHNADILYNSDFSPIYSKIMSSDSKSISSDSKVLEKKID